MRAIGFGVLAALVLAGPTLNGQVQDGTMSGTTALLRGGVIAAACAVGFALILGLVDAYRTQHEEAAAEAARAEAEAEEKAQEKAGAERTAAACPESA